MNTIVASESTACLIIHGVVAKSVSLDLVLLETNRGDLFATIIIVALFLFPLFLLISIGIVGGSAICLVLERKLDSLFILAYLRAIECITLNDLANIHYFIVLDYVEHFDLAVELSVEWLLIFASSVGRLHFCTVFKLPQF